MRVRGKVKPAADRCIRAGPTLRCASSMIYAIPCFVQVSLSMLYSGVDLVVEGEIG